MNGSGSCRCPLLSGSGHANRGKALSEGLRQLIRKASEIIICSCEFTSKADFILNEEITCQLKRNREVGVFGNHSDQMEDMMDAYGDLGLRAYRWLRPKESRETSLFHIKASTVDGTWIYIGSANMSLNAMENSVEWGVIAQSPELCTDLNDYVSELISSGLFKEV